ncbi:MAG TPA: PAS domain-containing protein [Anaerolineales bacterium]
MQPDPKDILDNLYDGVYFVDPERRITYWNNGAERITGYPAVRNQVSTD